MFSINNFLKMTKIFNLLQKSNIKCKTTNKDNQAIILIKFYSCLLTHDLIDVFD